MLKAGRAASFAAFLAGAGAGVCALLGATMLLYFAPQMLRTTGFLIGLVVIAAAVGAAAAGSPGETALRRRWLLLQLAYVAAGVYAALWTSRAELRDSSLGSALAALLLLAQPFYSTGALLATLPGRPVVPGLAGFAAGAVAGGTLLITLLPADVIFLSIAAVLLVARLFHDTATPEPVLPHMTMNGKVALVTGVGSSGQLGFAIARALLDAGARVICVDRSGKSEELARQLGAQAAAMHGDLSSEQDAIRIMDEVRARFGRLDALVNTAGGLTVIKPLAETTPAEWQAERQRNVDTAFVMSRAALPLLREAQGAIVNFASPAGARAVANLGAYSAAKSAVIALTRALAIEEKNYGVRVNAIAPGMIDTEQNRQSTENRDGVHWVSREEISALVVFLCSDAARALNGETITAVGNAIK